jgi:hypothetical protein
LVYFEEWDEPMLSGIAWVSELIEIAGGIDIFADRSAGKSAKERIATAEEIIARRPDIIIGSWCGKKFRPEKLAARAGFEQIPAVRNRALRARGSMGGQKNLAGYRWFESISLQQRVVQTIGSSAVELTSLILGRSVRVTSATHGEAELEDTVRALRKPGVSGRSGFSPPARAAD